ncbi:VOC family protein [Rhizobium leguminosarum]|uniref:Glyoxalase-like domain family protein n=1 Tax=Rhizobium leguminosarum TaxID=384 RepID=A0A2Z4YCA4_RHILE|nr:VOC family protein [Rhizobium leguminosarum]AXA38806.1 Glyoxalase-like domain family protein [Rhizobium leguminosarum]
MARLKEIVIDCDIPSRVAQFWAEALDGYEVMPYDDDELARLAALGLTPETDPTVIVEGPGTRLCFHLRQGERPDRNRLHFDIATPARAREVERLLSLGATFVREADGYTVLNDPEGNNFCVASE